MNTELVKPKSCRRCAGKGTVNSPVDFGRCFACAGAGQVEGDKATIAARKAYAAARTVLGQAAFDHSPAAHYGLSQLEVREPERCHKAVASFAAGRTDVLEALVAYGKAL